MSRERDTREGERLEYETRLERTPALHDPDEEWVEEEIETRRMFALFSTNVRQGPWEPPERLEAAAVFGSVKLDFREADLYPGVSEVYCFALFGSIDITVPEDLEVDVHGVGIFGGFDNQPRRAKRFGRRRRRRRPEPRSERYDDPEDEPPLLRIRGFALFGGVTVRVR